MYQDILTTINPDIKKHYVKNGQPVQSDILVYEDKIPKVTITGILTDYQFVNNQATDEKELYVKIHAEGQIFPIRVDSISVVGKPIMRPAIVNEFNQSEQYNVIQILKYAKGKNEGYTVSRRLPL